MHCKVIHKRERDKVITCDKQAAHRQGVGNLKDGSARASRLCLERREPSFGSVGIRRENRSNN